MKNRTVIRARRALPALLLALALLLGALPVSASAAETAPAAAAVLTFSNTGITASGGTEGYEISGTALTITAPGVYALTGSCTEGSVSVGKGVTGVTLVLDGLTLRSSTTAPIVCKKTSGVTLWVSGTNTLTSAEDASTEDANEDFEGAAIKVKSGGSLTVRGTGTLNIDASACKNGIKGAAEAAVTMAGATLNITAANHGLASDGSVVITGGTLNITAGNEAIKSEPDEDDTASAGTITITGGAVNVKDADDAIHATNTVTITGGALNIATQDDAIHSEYDVIIGARGASAGPSITVTKCYEGFEGATVTLNSGSGSIVASDDGINAATDQAVSEIAIVVNGGTWLVNAQGDGLDAGGDAAVNRGKGDLYFNGGVVEVLCSSNDNGALDFDGSCYLNGGTVLAVGGGMIETPTSGTYVLFGSGGMGMGMGGRPGQGQTPGGRGGMGQMPGGNMGMPGGQSGSVSASGTITIQDSAGNTLYTSKQSMSGGTVIFSSGALTSGQSYVMSSGGGAATATAVTGSGRSGSNAGKTPGNLPGGGEETAGQTETPEPAEELPESLAAFTDVAANAWYIPAVSYVIENGVMTGTSTTSFEPLTKLTRSMMAQILYNLEGRPAVDGDSDFTDVRAGSWYANAVDWAQENGVVSGYGDGTFGVSDPITRAQAATILKNYAELKGESVSGAATGFSDISSIPGWAQAAMGWCADTGILQGSGGALNPNGTASRAEIAAIMQRYLTL